MSHGPAARAVRCHAAAGAWVPPIERAPPAKERWSRADQAQRICGCDHAHRLAGLVHNVHPAAARWEGGRVMRLAPCALAGEAPADGSRGHGRAWQGAGMVAVPGKEQAWGGAQPAPTGASCGQPASSLSPGSWHQGPQSPEGCCSAPPSSAPPAGGSGRAAGEQHTHGMAARHGVHAMASGAHAC